MIIPLIFLKKIQILILNKYYDNSNLYKIEYEKELKNFEFLNH